MLLAQRLRPRTGVVGLTAAAAWGGRLPRGGASAAGHGHARGQRASTRPTASHRGEHVVAFREPYRSSSTSSSTTSVAPGKVAPRRDYLEARQVSLLELFDGANWQFDVPDYQRPYAWKAKQVHELLADLQAAHAAGQEHFLGALVTTRQGDAPGDAYQVIDGQQRLTTLVMLLAYLRHWAAAQPGLESLAERVHAMLFIPADPLNPAASARYRLRLRSSEQAFFAANFIDAYLPTKFHLSTQLDGPANAAGEYLEAAQALQPRQHHAKQGRGSSSGGHAAVAGGSWDSSSGNAAAAVKPAARSSGKRGADGSVPLANETHWRLYCAGDVLACHLAQAIDNGLNMQDFMHHVLKNCMVVLMTARDESTSFKIFSTLNGRGVDLAVIDKLKPELLQALPMQLRQQFADRWALLESALGRPSFHALFGHLLTIEAAAAIARGSAPASSLTSKAGSSAGSAGGGGLRAASSGGMPGAGLVPAGSTLIHQLRASPASASQGAAAAAAAAASGSVLEQFSGLDNAEGALSMVLEYGQRLLQIRANDWSALAAEGGTAPAIAAELEDACFYVNLLADDSWQPWALEFFYQSSDDAKRAAFLRGAELLQIYCELKQDEAFKAERWLAVGTQLLQRPFYSDRVLAALALSADEADDFVKLLDSRELAASADEGLLAHLLLRADCISRRSLDWRRIKVEKVMPSQPPEGSQWRRQKLLLPALSEADLAASSSGSGAVAAMRGRGGSSGGSRASGGSSGRSSSSSRASRGRTTSSSGLPDAAAAGISSLDAGASGSSSSSSTSVPPGIREVRYWHEITRSHWHNRLGNLVLLQPSGHESTPGAQLSSDLASKLGRYAASEEHFPEFTGGLASGHYTRDNFSPEECRQRHADIISRLIAAFGLSSSGL